MLRSLMSGLGLVAVAGSAAATAAADHAALLAAMEPAISRAASLADPDGTRLEILSKGTAALYDGFSIHLDAEELAEGRVGEFLLAMRPMLADRGVATLTVVDDAASRWTGAETDEYRVMANEKEFTIWEGPDLSDTTRLWARAATGFFDLVNAILPDGVERFYALYSDNDLTGIFLPPEAVVFFNDLAPDQRPYVPTNVAPYYGMQHD